MTFAERVAADRRLALLRMLVEGGGGANESVIERNFLALGERTGIDRAVVRQFIRDLEKTDCVVVSMYMDRVMVADITKRGVAVAEGRISVDGVSKPSLGV